MCPSGVFGILDRWGTPDNHYLADPTPDTVGSGEGTAVTVAPQWHMLSLLGQSIASATGDHGGPTLCACDPDPGS